jgi:hypothetical protein
MAQDSPGDQKRIHDSRHDSVAVLSPFSSANCSDGPIYFVAPSKEGAELI